MALIKFLREFSGLLFRATEFDALPIHAEAMPCVHRHSPDSGLYRRLIDQMRTAHIKSKVHAERPC